MKKGTKTALVIIALVAFGFGGLIVGMYLAVFHSGSSIPEGSYLVILAGGELTEQPAIADPLAEALGAGATMSVIEIDSALRKAAVDDRIEGVILRIEPLATGLGKVQELRGAIKRYRTECDKPIIAWLETGGNKEYYLATACSRIVMAPEGMLLVNGVRFAVTFFAGTLEKLGVQAEFARIGQYKSAVEPYTREEMSDAFREVLDSLADDIFDQMVRDMASDRDMTPEELRAIIDDPPMTARGALEAGLIDDLVYRDEMEAELKDPDEEHWSLVDMATYAGVSPSSLGLGEGRMVAVIYCEGAIMSGESSPPMWGGDRTMGSSTITRAIRQAREDEDIEALVLRVDSPGGSGLASDLIWREVILTRETKPVVVSMGDYAASGGYYIAMGADAIVAQPGTLTGSIGVFAGKFNLEGLYEMVGLSVETVERGQYANLLTSSRPFTDDERRKLEVAIEDFYDTFITKAAEGRGVDPSEIDRVARGRVWTGAQASEVGLVDALGGFRTALAMAKERAGIGEDEEVTLVILPEQATLLEELLGPSSGPSTRLRLPHAVCDTLPEVDQALDALLAVAPLLSSGAPTALSPYHLFID